MLLEILSYLWYSTGNKDRGWSMEYLYRTYSLMLKPHRIMGIMALKPSVSGTSTKYEYHVLYRYRYLYCTTLARPE